MNRAEQFRDIQKELLKDRGIGVAEIQAVYLGEIAYNLAIIVDCLEPKREKEERKAECAKTN